ncbi:hypothetical protein ACFL1I_08220 [Candidatus Omnitrophota bacterium]
MEIVRKDNCERTTYQMPHTSEEILLDYIENNLFDKERVEIEHHLRFCHRCMNLLRIGQNLPTEEELKKIKVPKDWTERAKRILFKRGKK